LVHASIHLLRSYAIRSPFQTGNEEHYRALGARYRHMAQHKDELSIREGLLELSRQCNAMAAELELRQEGLFTLLMNKPPSSIAQEANIVL